MMHANKYDMAKYLLDITNELGKMDLTLIPNLWLLIKNNGLSKPLFYYIR